MVVHHDGMESDCLGVPVAGLDIPWTAAARKVLLRVHLQEQRCGQQGVFELLQLNILDVHSPCMVTKVLHYTSDLLEKVISR